MVIILKVNEKIKTVRKEKGISQLYLSKRLSMSISSYNMKENGRRPITIDELENISAILDVSPSIFFDKQIHVKLNNHKSTA